MVDPLLYDGLGILIDTVQAISLIPKDNSLYRRGLVVEMLEASRAKTKALKRDNGNGLYKCIAKLIIYLVEGSHGKLCGSGPSFALTIDSFKQLLRITDILSMSEQTWMQIWMLIWMLCTCIFLMNETADSNQYGAVSNLRIAFMSYGYGGISVPFKRQFSAFAPWAFGEDLDNPQTDAYSDHRPELFWTLVEDMVESINYSLSMNPEIWTVNLMMELSEPKRMDAHNGIGSPAPPSPGSDRSQISFLSDSVTDWKELVRGRGPYDSTQGNEEA